MANVKKTRDCIVVGDYVISADKYQWILSKQHISNGSRNPNLSDTKGEKIETVIGYYGSLPLLVEKIIDDSMKDMLSETEDLRSLVTKSLLNIAETVKKLESDE